MALIGNCASDKNDVRYTFPDCYARISDVTQENAVSGMTFIKVILYADAAARQLVATPVVGRVYTCPTADFPKADTSIIAGYEYIKTLPDFAGWVDG